MSLYLAYQFEARELTKPRLIKILDEFWDQYHSYRCSTSKELCEVVQAGLIGHMSVISPKKNLLSKAKQCIHSGFRIKMHPLLYMLFRYKDCEGPVVPPNFSGITIDQYHSGSESFLELIQFKPITDAFFTKIGIKYEDRSKIALESMSANGI